MLKVKSAKSQKLVFCLHRKGNVTLQNNVECQRIAFHNFSFSSSVQSITTGLNNKSRFASIESKASFLKSSKNIGVFNTFPRRLEWGRWTPPSRLKQIQEQGNQSSLCILSCFVQLSPYKFICLLRVFCWIISPLMCTYQGWH